MSRKKKKSTRNDIAMAYRIDALPGRVSKRVVFDTLISFLDGETTELPDGWEITWLWRNSRKSKLRSDEFTEVVSKSRSSFMSVMRRRLERDLNALGYTVSGRKATKKRKRKARSWKRRHKVKSSRVSKVRRKKSKHKRASRRRKNA